MVYLERRLVQKKKKKNGHADGSLSAVRELCCLGRKYSLYFSPRGIIFKRIQKVNEEMSSSTPDHVSENEQP